MNFKNLKSLASAAILATLTGCVSPAPYLESHIGSAVNTAKAQQTINPDASKNPDPVAGIDGRAAKSSVEHYEDSFKAPPPTFNVINIGGSGAR
ncbi:MAG TPA: hypothetical protein VLD36_23035 [Burkholderiales bacterium]|jgi:hypothetical protein|nr:hypothetical protein [Burkholderiales bacterium]